MAGLGGPKVLLLWAGLLGLARCQSSQPTDNSTSQASSQTAPPNVRKQAEPLTTTPSDLPSTSNRQTNHSAPNTVAPSQALPASTSTTQNQSLPTPPTPIPTSLASTPPSIKPVILTTGTQTARNCTYSVENIEHGLQIKIARSNTSDPVDYVISLTEMSGNRRNFQRKCTGIPSDNSTFNTLCPIYMLRPCTNYSVMVNYGNETCEQSVKQTVRTGEIVESDINPNTVCVPGYLCYESKWDIDDTIQTKKASIKTCNNTNRKCIKLNADDFCSELKTYFSCLPSNIIKTPITLDLFERSSVNIEVKTSNTFPVQTNWTNKPQHCNDSIELDYSCQTTGKGASNVNISMLEPYTKYDCTGRVKLNNQTTNKTTSFIVNVDCGLKIDLSSPTQSNTSISLSGKTSSGNCLKEQLLKLSYRGCCSPVKDKTECKAETEQYQHGLVEIEGLIAYKYYNCCVNPYYNGQPVKEKTCYKINTKPGIPGAVKNLQPTLQENNYYIIKCDDLEKDKWNGESITYIAFLNDGQERKERKNSICKFHFKDLRYSTTYTLTVFAFNGEFNSTQTEKKFATRYNDKAAIGILGFFIILTSLALIFVVYKIYLLHRKKFGNNDETVEMFEQSNEDNLLNVEPIVADLLLDTYKRKIADEGRLFLAEFQSIPRIFSSYTAKEARKQCNHAKNRYIDILPYDHNRVQLTSGRGETGWDYINASFIDGYKESKKYIAAQGPKEETVADFWRMIWEQQSSIIVMVTRCEESNRNKCAQYWPSAEHEAEIFDEFVVKLNGEDLCPDYIIRRLSLTNKRDKSSEREVTHIQFTSWPDHGVPGEPHLLLKLRRRVNAFKNFFSGPIVIHCSAGVGRTGSYISIDAMMEGLDLEGRVDIYGFVVGLRRQRSLMVQVEAQYILIHQALIEYNQFGETEIPLAEFHSTLCRLQNTDPGNDPSLLECEFQRLPRYKNWRTFNMGTTEENKKKNRYSSVIPYDYNRVLVKMEDENSHDSDQESDEDESSDEEEETSSVYINASHIDGYWCPRSLIAAQGPLPHTSADFWQMVYGKKSHALVMLSDCTEGNQEFCSAYWGDSKMTFGEVEVEVTGTDVTAAYTVRTMQLRHAKRKERRQVRQYHFLKWAGRELPENSQELTDMIRNIKQACGRSQSEGSGPIVVHCNDGSSRSGVFCALWNLLDCAETEKLVDVFQVAKALRKERQGMITKLEQYQFLYDALDGAFPVQNGEVKQAAPSAASVQIVNETQPEPAGSTAASDQQGAGSAAASSQQGAAAAQQAEETVPLVSSSGKDRGNSESEGGSEEPRPPSETTPLEDTSNGPLVTVDL
ncbi:receptor-type tyrosine-protein phosphatase C isoform X2 [Osmerus eperlanus]|uniref:receptor-type tyrosine-protein phosphatase C isoform X2 n=1 Tax=Osmerus eperlanus TaxID=29151 RepID=UPI002E10FCDA